MYFAEVARSRFEKLPTPCISDSDGLFRKILSDDIGNGSETK